MKIKIASRSSKLALKQVEEFNKTFLIKEYDLIETSTRGDELSAKGETLFDKGNFVSDIEKLILNDSVDVAIHSAKDMPAKKTKGLKHLYFIENSKRKVKDLLIFRKDTEPNFKKDMKLGTSSLRRKMQARFHMNATNIEPLNGNIDTRLKKLNDGQYDCIILAEAGLSRLDFLIQNQNYKRLDHTTCSGQGVLAVQWKEGNAAESIIKSSQIYKDMTNLNKEINMERELLVKLNADCNSAISLLASENYLSGEIYGVENFISFSGNDIN
jgi:hydroxymethylbilane synthase